MTDRGKEVVRSNDPMATESVGAEEIDSGIEILPESVKLAHKKLILRIPWLPLKMRWARAHRLAGPTITRNEANLCFAGVNAMVIKSARKRAGYGYNEINLRPLFVPFQSCQFYIPARFPIIPG